MDHSVYQRLVSLAEQPDAVAASVAYLSEHMRFLKKREKVLICFHSHSEHSIGDLMARAVVDRGAEPVTWKDDLRWKTLLRLAFSSRASTIIGEPLIVLGLAKLARANGTPLNVRNVITAGYPCPDWMIDGIIRTLDCRTWGCFGPGMDAVVGGFSCGKSRGVHLREDVYGIDIVDGAGASLPIGETGEMVFYPLAQPEARLPLGEMARLERSPCPCGCSSVRLMDMQAGSTMDPDISALSQYLHSWTSVLDCRLEKGSYGLEMEIITFPGEKLPILPSCAKQILRPWDPERDEPFPYSVNYDKM